MTGFSLGQRVSGVVKKVTKEGGCTLSLENEVLGVVEAYHCTGSLLIKKQKQLILRSFLSDGIKKGMMVKGVVLWVDYVENHVEISLDPKVISSISENQGTEWNRKFRKSQTIYLQMVLLGSGLYAKPLQKSC